MELENYFSSLCIANFGVDPTIATLFFLFLPAFFFLKFLLHFVCIVLDAILLSLRSSIFKFRSVYLSILLLIVKIILSATICNSTAFADETRKIEDLFLGKGEQVTLHTKNLTHYSIGNKEVIKHIYRKKSNNLHIKGKSLGFTDLVIWSGKKKRVIHIYVLSKKEQLKKVQVASLLNRLELNVSISGELIITSGTIETLHQYYIIQNLRLKKLDNLIFNLKLSPQLIKDLYSIVYSRVYQFGANKVICKNFELDILCSTEGINNKSKPMKALAKKYHIGFDYNITNIKDKNYLARFKIIQVESLEQVNIGLGLSKISAPLLDLIQGRHISLIEGQSSEISELNIKATLLSEPQSLITLGNKSNLSLGGEIPYSNINNETETTQWKFFGLKITTLLENKNGKAFINYKTTLTTPKSNTVEGTKASAGIFINLNKYSKLFEIGHTFYEDQNKGVPLLMKIPFFKYLFSDNRSVQSYKHIICYIQLEEINE